MNCDTWEGEGMESPTVWRGSTLGERAQDRREQFIAAGFRLIGADGTGAAAVRALCREAELSAKYFYETFDSRGDLVIAVYDRVVGELVEVIGAADIHGKLPERLRITFMAAAAYFEEDPRRARILFRETLVDDVLRDHAVAAIPVFVLHVAQVVWRDGGSAGLADPDKLGLVVSSLSGALVMVFLNWLEGRISATADEVADHCTDLVLALHELGTRTRG
ncbi:MULTISPECIES: TetR/AcrR family transcriptional regulator [unclassified Rhodococcus (in: high G+C Gram-positive bacteria)]|uniref:TetR/AcrR family transcriptional regulator n=1 Tax=unclassified Rhodococcus (in: high G+C Gram-positive bacteria) TaxID=192944 RepID=UPI001C596544|nr:MULTISPECIES: TetR family transcriptional regulator [unclassified Rhodococcus (in: high G+C Gram-positive bacteria)]MCT7293671.1 TetR family transcriptional regulator [Rhodococcus sp. PAE-6]QXU56452.1 TetR family transcriptional regulator [Rhodococcus sp. LW-XY12]